MWFQECPAYVSSETSRSGNARAFRTSKELFADSPHLAMPGATVEVMEITSM